MAAPEYVPTKPATLVRTYESPPRRPEPWVADRPAEIHGRQPEGEGLGHPGPDQGYALTLAHRFQDRLLLAEGEQLADAIAGVSAVAMRRNALFGRAPVMHDLTVAATVWGFLDPNPDPELVDIRRRAFEEVHLAHHYPELRRIVDAVREDVLLLPHSQVADRYASDWRSCLDLSEL